MHQRNPGGGEVTLESSGLEGAHRLDGSKIMLVEVTEGRGVRVLGREGQ